MAKKTLLYQTNAIFMKRNLVLQALVAFPAWLRRFVAFLVKTNPTASFTVRGAHKLSMFVQC
jgi:hypothetical protein